MPKKRVLAVSHTDSRGGLWGSEQQIHSSFRAALATQMEQK